jgi:hypothetical protein
MAAAVFTTPVARMARTRQGRSKYLEEAVDEFVVEIDLIGSIATRTAWPCRVIRRSMTT